MRWFAKGDKYTRFFYVYVKGRRKKLHIAEITNKQGLILQTNQQMGEKAVEFFKEQFLDEEVSQN